MGNGTLYGPLFYDVGHTVLKTGSVWPFPLCYEMCCDCCREPALHGPLSYVVESSELKTGFPWPFYRVMGTYPHNVEVTGILWLLLVVDFLHMTVIPSYTRGCYDHWISSCLCLREWTVEVQKYIFANIFIWIVSPFWWRARLTNHGTWHPSQSDVTLKEHSWPTMAHGIEVGVKRSLGLPEKLRWGLLIFSSRLLPAHTGFLCRRLIRWTCFNVELNCTRPRCSPTLSPSSKI